MKKLAVNSSLHLILVLALLATNLDDRCMRTSTDSSFRQRPRRRRPLPLRLQSTTMTKVDCRFSFREALASGFGTTFSPPNSSTIASAPLSHGPLIRPGTCSRSATLAVSVARDQQKYLESHFVPRKMGTSTFFYGVMSHCLRYFVGSRYGSTLEVFARFKWFDDGLKST